MPDPKTMVDLLATTVQVVSVVTGVVISVLSFNATRRKEAEARELEAAKPFFTMRQNIYAEAIKEAGVLANPEVHTAEELVHSRKRFRALYVAELSMVEAPEVEEQMIALATQIDPDLLDMTPAQKAAYDLAHALGATFTQAWRVQGK